VKITDHPFPHFVEDDMWEPALLARVLDEFPPTTAPGWKRYSNSLERKLEGPPGLWGPATRELFAQIEKLGPELESAFGINGLTMETVGGGYHCIEPGGFLQMHTDFSISPRTRRYRRLNLLIYLNENWTDPGAHLELWDDNGPAVDIAPEFNRTVVFQTSSKSWHGHPKPAARVRRSVAAYFFTAEPPPDFGGEQSTVWHPGASS
jgi:Rps23 Pro-64 3,4-dihydroxylase Tpa1-like proline 4-hydroxylase